MTWFKVDDTLAFHHKAVAAGNAAMGLWVRAGSWSAQQLTDGFIPASIATTIGTPPQIARLVRVRLWVETEGGYTFHQWGEEGRQPTRGDVEARRENDRDRKRIARESKRNPPQTQDESEKNIGQFSEDPQVSDSCPAGVSRETRPDPTRPKPKNPPGRLGKITPDRAPDDQLPPPDDQPPLPSIPDPPPGPAVTGPSAADAYRLVDAAIGREYPHTVRTALAIEVGALLVVDTDRELVFAALRLWLDKPHLGPKSLPSLVSEVIRMRNRTAAGSRPSTTDQRVQAGLDLAAELRAESDQRVIDAFAPTSPPELRVVGGEP